jgi:hypothetical protein
LTADVFSTDVILGRLYLVSDILYASEKAFEYRTAFEASLPKVYVHLGKILASKGRINGEYLNKSVASVINSWTSWMVFDDAFIQKLADSFLQREQAPLNIPASAPIEMKFSSPVKSNNETRKKSTFKPAVLIEDSSSIASLLRDESDIPPPEKKRSRRNSGERRHSSSNPLNDSRSSKPSSSVGLQSKKSVASGTFKSSLPRSSLGGGKKVGSSGGGFKISFASAGSVLDSVKAHEDIDGEALNEEDLYEHIDGEPMDVDEFESKR